MDALCQPTGECFHRQETTAGSRVMKSDSDPFSAALSNHSHNSEVVHRNLCWSAGAKKVRMSVMALPILRRWQSEEPFHLSRAATKTFVLSLLCVKAFDIHCALFW